MLKKLVLVDGSSLLSTSFYGTLPKEYFYAKTEEEKKEALGKLLKTSTGIYTNGVYAMCRILLNILEKQAPTHMAVAWDISRDTFRRKLYPDYKAQRKETIPELKSQFKLMQNVLERMDVPQFMFEEYEADDIIGTLARKFETEISTYIISKDQDLLQVVNDFTRMWLITTKAEEMCKELGVDIRETGWPDNVFEFTPPLVEHFYGIRPQQIPDKKALEGDKSDNIPGVKGLGEKTVLPLLQEYGTIEDLYAAIEGLSEEEENELKRFFKEALGISRSPLKNLLKQPENPGEICGKEAAFLSKKLATINTNVPGLEAVELDALELHLDCEGMRKVFEELEFNSLLSKIE